MPADTIIRLNLAWIKTYQEAEKILSESNFPVYLDYPSGRTKPPKPVIGFQEAIALSKHPRVKYFAISNAESIALLKELMETIPGKIIVPKIETVKGVELIPKMIEAGINTLMLDKEDLYTNVKADSELYEILVDKVRKSGIKVLELQGVIFI